MSVTFQECLHEASAMASFGVPSDPARIVSYFPGMSARSFSHSIFWCAFRSCTDCQLLSRNVCTKLQPWHLLVCLQSLHGLSATFQECLHEASAMASFGVPPEPARIVSHFPGMSARSFSHGIFWCASRACTDCQLLSRNVCTKLQPWHLLVCLQSLHGLSVTFQECLHEASAMASFGVPPEPARIVSYFPGMSARSFSHSIFWCAFRSCTDCPSLSRNVCTKLQPWHLLVCLQLLHGLSVTFQECLHEASAIASFGVPSDPARIVSYFPGMSARSFSHGIFWCASRACTDCQPLSRNVCTKLQPWHLLVCLQSLHGLSATFQECLHEASAMASFGVPPEPARIVSYFPGMSAGSFSHGIFWCASRACTDCQLLSRNVCTKLQPWHLLVCLQSLHGLSVTFQECLHEASAQSGQTCAIANASCKRTPLAAML